MAEPAGGNDADRRPARRRVFFALWPDEPTRKAISRATRAAVRQCGGKPTPVANLHITLAFLGPVTPADLAKVEALTPPTAVPFELVLDRLAHWERSGVLWIGPSVVPEALLTLERELWDLLVGLGFTRERRPYQPHITLARKAQAARGTVDPVTWRIDGIALVESKTGPRSSRYTVLKDWALTAPG